MSNQSLQLTRVDHLELDSLAKAINQRQDDITIMMTSMVKTGKDALVEIALIGKDLDDAKSRIKNNALFVRWLENNCPHISRATAYRYIKVHHHPDLLEKASNLRGLLALCEPKRTQKIANQKKYQPDAQCLYLVSRFVKHAKTYPMKDYPKDTLNEIGRQLWLIARWLSAMGYMHPLDATPTNPL